MVCKNNKELQVSALKDGTVIDHIPSDKLFKVFSLLKLDKIKNQITIGNNLESSFMGKKGIIKITDIFYSDEELNRIAVIAPQAKINIIKNYEVVSKRILNLPDEIENVIKCQNPKCITNNEPMKTRFDVVDKNPIKLECRYCGKITLLEDIILK